MGFIHAKRLSITIIGKDKDGNVWHHENYEEGGFVTSSALSTEEKIAELDKEHPGLKWEYEVFTID